MGKYILKFSTVFFKLPLAENIKNTNGNFHTNLDLIRIRQAVRRIPWARHSVKICRHSMQIEMPGQFLFSCVVWKLPLVKISRPWIMAIVDRGPSSVRFSCSNLFVEWRIWAIFHLCLIPCANLVWKLPLGKYSAGNFHTISGSHRNRAQSQVSFAAI